MANLKLPVILLLLVSVNLLPAHAQDNLFRDQSTSSLIQILKSDADTFAKAKACEQLAIVGDESCIEALVSLLGDPKLNAYALNSLQQIPGEHVDAALLSAMDSRDGISRIGIIHAIGERQIDAAEKQLVELCRMPDIETSQKQAAIRALGALGKIDRLNEIQPIGQLESRTIQDAILRALPDRHRGVEGDLSGVADDAFRQTLASLDVQSSRSAVLSSLTKLSPTRQVLALHALANLDTRSIKSDERRSQEIFIKLAASEHLEVAAAAVKLLVAVGYFDRLTALPAWLQSRPDLMKTTLPLLSQTENRLLDRDVVFRLRETASSDSPERILGLIGYVSGRRLSEATPALIELAMGSNKAVASAAIVAAGYTASIDQFGSLLDLLTENSDEKIDQAEIDVCMSRACVRLPRDSAASMIENKLQRVDGEVALWLMNSLAQLGGKEALAVVTRAAKSGDETLVDGATRALGEWLSADVAVALEGLIATLPSGNYRTRALRAYLRVGRQFDMPDNERLALCRHALQLADRDEERLLVVDILGRNPSLESANLLLEILRNPAHNMSKLQKQALAELSSVAEKVDDSDAKILHAAFMEAGVLLEHESARERLKRFAE